uniref:Serine/threonine protein kinase n=1 Tax=Solibacter usitatus (strain Ellin6076) TaxID=234267 RepID=Q01SR4_SOLUE
MKQQWDDLRALFDAAWPLPAAARSEFLNERCGDDPRFRRELEKLLAAHDEGEAAAARNAAGRRRFGAWETIGRAGQDDGNVYLVERMDGQPPQRASLKVMARRMVSSEYLDRFRREREILARLDHSHIARLVDGGVSESGEAYLVAEYVEGAPVDEYCEQCGLPLQARLRLFLALCSAVECAHCNLIVHRDIRPANVLVTREGVLKLVNFGNGDPTENVTTAVDVRGLGVTLGRLVPKHGGCLAGVILKAAESDPAQQYGSAFQLARDVEQYLEKLFVQAR